MNLKGILEMLSRRWMTIVIVILLMAGCWAVSFFEEAKAEVVLPYPPISHQAKTVEHDGHWLIVINQEYRGTGLIHHPDCPKCEGK